MIYIYKYCKYNEPGVIAWQSNAIKMVGIFANTISFFFKNADCKYQISVILYFGLV